jgi:hypothetical protein
VMGGAPRPNLRSNTGSSFFSPYEGSRAPHLRMPHHVEHWPYTGIS